MNQHFTKHLQASIKYEMRRYVSAVQLRNDKINAFYWIYFFVFVFLQKKILCEKLSFFFFLES